MPLNEFHKHLKKHGRVLMLLVGAGMLGGAFTFLALAGDADLASASQQQSRADGDQIWTIGPGMIGRGGTNATSDVRIMSWGQGPTTWCGAGFRSISRPS